VELTLTAMLEAAAGGSGRTAVVDHAAGREMSYAELLERSSRLAGGLGRLGFRRGDRLANWLPNGIDWLVLHFAAARLGLNCPLVNTRYRAAELEHVLRAAEPRGLAIHPGFHGIDFAATLAGAGRAVEHVLTPGDLADLGSSGTTAPAAGAGDVAVLFTTSGTTASPKLAGHDQRGIVKHARACAGAFDVRAGDVMLLALPLCGAFGFVGAMAALSAGAALVVQAVFDARETVALLERHGVTHFFGSDAMLRAVLDAAAGDRGPFERWRWGCHANFGGQPLELVRRAEAEAGVRLHGTYGSSECFAMMSRWPAGAPAEVRAPAGGFLVSDEMQVRACDPETGRPLARGEPGELQFRGYNVMTGYHGNPTATAAAFTEDGWYRSGDLGQVDEGGSFLFLSRLKDSLRVRGYLVDPLEIEEELERHPAVEVAQVVGARLPGEGDVPVAFVKLRPGASAAPEELTSRCRERLAAYKVPRLVRLVEEFPVVDGPNGRKIQKVRLREIAADQLATEMVPGSGS
jgi:acyl-CoA synthetase (AMP-forming)/AMP-acid ligase II